MTEEERNATMGKWMAWFESFKDKQIDGGAPFGEGGMAVTADGATVIPADMWPATGYTIISAKDMKDATDIASGCPAVVDKVPGAAVRVYEAMPM